MEQRDTACVFIFAKKTWLFSVGMPTAAPTPPATRSPTSHILFVKLVLAS